MEIGALSALRGARERIHSASPHSYSSVHAREAVDGGTSANKANGSALSISWPVALTIRNLYPSPRVTAATVPSQMPDASPRGASGSALASQPFHAPMTDTREAFGAQTRKVAPATPSWQPISAYNRLCVPSRN